MSQGVENVGVSEGDSRQFLRVLKSRRYVEALYKQVEQVVDGKVLRKLVTIADFKTSKSARVPYHHPRLGTIDRYLFQSLNSFAKVFRRALWELPKQVEEKCGVEGFFAEVYASAMWFLDRGAFESNWWDVIKGAEDFAGAVLVPIAYDFVIDLDLKNNPWLAEEDGLRNLKLFCEFMTEKLGLEPSVLFSKGVQLRVTLLPLHLLHYEKLGDVKWPKIVIEKLPEMHRRIALKLAREFYEKHGTRVVVDKQIYEPSRIVRLDLSIHSGIKAFSIPFKPHMLEGLTWNKVRGLQRNTRYAMAIAKRLSGTWGRIVDSERYLGVLGFFLALEGDLRLDIKLPKLKPLKASIVSGWKKIIDPVLSEIEYDGRLEGFGWVEVLVKEKIPIPDGRLAFCWAVLPVAIKGPKTKEGKLQPLITKEEAIEWLKKCVEKYPDPEKSLKDYIEKLEYNLRYGEKYNIPTWKHLVGEHGENKERLAEVFLHIKYPVIYTFHESGYIRLNKEQLKKLKELL